MVIETPTQVANPAQAVKRTSVAVIVGIAAFLPVLNIVLTIIQDELQKAVDLSIPSWVWVVLNGALALIALVSGILTRVMAIPQVNDWLSRVQLGAAAPGTGPTFEQKVWEEEL